MAEIQQDADVMLDIASSFVLDLSSFISLHADNAHQLQDVAWLQPALSALPARASPNQASLLLPQQHSQQLPQQHSQQYSQGNSYQTAQATNHPPPRNHQAWHGLPTWERPVGHPHLNQVRSFSMRFSCLSNFWSTAIPCCTNLAGDVIGALPVMCANAA